MHEVGKSHKVLRNFRAKVAKLGLVCYNGMSQSPVSASKCSTNTYDCQGSEA